MDENISKNIRDDLILFKNETLKEIKESEKQLLDKFSNLEFTIIEKVVGFENQFMKFSQKIKEITSFIDRVKDVTININNLLEYKIKSENSLIDLSFKIKSLDKDFNKTSSNINNILKDSVIYPGIIGSSSKFKTFHDIIDYTLLNISHFKAFKDKITKDVNSNKNNCDNNTEKLKIQIEEILDKSNSIIAKEIATIEEKTNTNFKSYEEKLQKIKKENEKNNDNINNELEQLMNNLKGQLNEINEIKKELVLKFNELKDKYNENNKGINDLNEKNSKLSKFIKEIKYKIDSNTFFNELYLNNKMNKKQVSKERKSYRFSSASNIDLKKSKLRKSENGLSELIKDEINAECLQTYQNKTNHKINETYKNGYGIYNRENKNNKNNNTIYNFLEKSQSYKRFPLNKEDKIITSQNNNLKEVNINTSQSKEYYNSLINNSTKRTKHNENLGTSDDSFKFKSLNDLDEKTSDTNLLLNNKYIRIKQLKYFSLNQQHKMFYAESNNIDNKKDQNLFQNNINNFNSSKKQRYISGYPRIVTNQGERILISSHPIYHREKFTNNFNPSMFISYKNINSFYNKKKENKKNLNNNINIYGESKFLYDKKNKNKQINEKVKDYDFYNDNNIFKTMPNPKHSEIKNKKEIMGNIGRHYSYKNNKNNKNNKLKKAK